MNAFNADQQVPRKPLRLWPGVTAAVLVLVLRFGVSIVAPEAERAGLIAVLGGFLCALAIFIWWAFFSRARRADRWGAIGLMIVAVAATHYIVDKSIATGMMGMMLYFYSIPALALALVAGALAGRRLDDGPRRAVMAVAIVIACGIWALLRTDGILGGGGAQFAWRWSPTAEELLLAHPDDEPAALLPASPEPAVRAETPPLPDTESEATSEAQTSAAPTSAIVSKASLPAAIGNEPPAPVAAVEPQIAWPGFRGPGRDGIVTGLRIETDWSVSPPAELWRRPVGPGWSSFAVRDHLLYTQEQRGEDEVVACYELANGAPVWMHRDATRFWESNAGAGPRATPTLAGGRVYTFGATGILNALDAGGGALAWSRDAASDAGVKVPMWGFASSPLVHGDLVIVAVSGRLAAYNLANGEPRWMGPKAGVSYSSPQLQTIGGVEQILLLSETGASSVDPSSGALLWQHSWEGFASLQPAQTAAGDIVMTTGAATGGLGMRRLAITQGPNGWTVKERWTSNGLKPYFNDFVVHKGHAYGFDGRILSCIGLEDGQRKWKGGRYGNGQLVLLPDQDLLLVLSDVGELALVSANPAEFKELARFKAIEGKTWNHPAVVSGIVLVRNDREMAAFRLAPAVN